MSLTRVAVRLTDAWRVRNAEAVPDWALMWASPPQCAMAARAAVDAAVARSASAMRPVTRLATREGTLRITRDLERWLNGACGRPRLIEAHLRFDAPTSDAPGLTPPSERAFLREYALQLLAQNAAAAAAAAPGDGHFCLGGARAVMAVLSAAKRAASASSACSLLGDAVDGGAEDACAITPADVSRMTLAYVVCLREAGIDL
jgi:hypothetical protein